MIRRPVSRLCVLVVAAVVFTAPAGPARLHAQDLGTEAQRESGRQLYAKYCSQCHGEKGDGEGYATSHLYPRPRNFTTGKFKIRTTPNGALPTHEDLVNVIRRGMPYTSMPAWPNLSDRQVSDLAYYIKTFSPEFANPANVPKPVELPRAPAATEETVKLGQQLYEETGCVRCHGTLGRGDGPSAPTLKDDWGHPIRAADLSQPWTFRGGATREDIFRTMSTGLNGTPMPAFDDALSPEQRWAITDFVLSLSDDTEPHYTNLVIARYVQEPIDLTKGTAIFADAPAARLPIIGQITEPGRSFHPPTTSIVVQAVYDADSIAVLVRWHDMSAQKTGTNSPSLIVPSEEEENAPAASTDESGGESGSVFGDAEVASAPEGQAQDPFAEAETPAEESEFSDAVAIQIPSQVPTGARKPYFIFGDPENAVDLWFFDLATEAPVELTARGSANITPGTGTVAGVASYDQGEWAVVFERPIRPESGASFSPGEFLPMAFSVWDGFSRERGNRRGLTPWYSIYLEPEVVPSAAGPMITTALLILGLELAVIGWVRWRYRSQAGGALGGEPGQPATTRA
ncbi:MAG TPA: c-type cytochrome [Vicinamibacterales bacterium]